MATAGCALAILGCATTIPRVDPGAPAFAGKGEAELAELRRGRGEYVAKCSGCHPPYPPSRGTTAQWEDWIDEMADRITLAPEERARILEYLGAAAMASRSSAGLEGTR